MSERLLDPNDQPKFVNPLPDPPVIDASVPGTYEVQVVQVQQWLGLTGSDEDGDGTADPLVTTVWGYGQPGQPATHPGPTFVAWRDRPIWVLWDNLLPRSGHLLPVDTDIHVATLSPEAAADGQVPVVTHLHGGHSTPESDGLPEAWYTQEPSEYGPDFQRRVLSYDNDQPSATLWYHDHTLGMTRLNVQAGLAGFYLLRDTGEADLVASGVLPGRVYEHVAAVQDRAFTRDGQLYLPAYAQDPLPGAFPATVGDVSVPDVAAAFPGTIRDVLGSASTGSLPGAAENILGPDFTGIFPDTVADILGPGFTGTYPSIVPEFFGDFILVNGMTWPKFDADPGAYRFHLLNGSDSRFFVLRPDNPYVKITLVGSDGGLLPQAVVVADGDGVQRPWETLVLAPGDRADVVFDLSAPQLRGRSVTLLNEGPVYQTFQGLNADGSLADAVQAATPADSVGRVMRFDIGAEDVLPNTATVTDGTVLDASYRPIAEGEASRTRELGLFEGTDARGRVTPKLGVAEDTVDVEGQPVGFGPRNWHDPVTEAPALGTSEVWEIYNFTDDAHPIHLHLTQFQVLGRDRIAFTDADGDGVPDDVRGAGAVTAGGDPAADDVVKLAPLPLGPMDMGWQDTAWVGPNEAIRIVAPFDKPGGYVWHCHILSHEDNEMMRPFLVVATDR